MGRNPKQECLTLYPEVEQIAENLTDKQLGTLMRALIQYRFQGIVTEFPKDVMLGVVFGIMKNQVDRMEQVKKRNSENARRRWEQAGSGPSQTPTITGIPVELGDGFADAPFYTDS